MKNFIKHHGILNQKWGERNGPPYPLVNASSMASNILKRLQAGKQAVDKFIEKNKEKKLNSIKMSDDAKILSENIDKFSTQELQDRVTRQRLIKELENYVPKKREGFIKKTVSGFVNGLSTRMSNALIDKIVNSVTQPKNSYSYEDAKKIAEDFKKGNKDKDGNTYKLSGQELENIFKIINNANSIDRILYPDKSSNSNNSNDNNIKNIKMKNKNEVVNGKMFVPNYTNKSFKNNLKDLRAKGYI